MARTKTPRKSAMSTIDFEGLTNDDLIGLFVKTCSELKSRGLAAEAEAWAESLVANESSKIAKLAAEAAASALAHAKARQLAEDLLKQQQDEREKADREQRQKEEQEKIDKVAKLWKEKSDISERLHEILGRELEIAPDLEAEKRELDRTANWLADSQAKQGKWHVPAYVYLWDSEAEAVVGCRGKGLSEKDLKQHDDSARMAAWEARIKELKDKIEATPAIVRVPQSYRLEVWSKGTDRRVFVSRAQAKFGESLFDWYHSGNQYNAPKTAKVIYDQVDASAKATGKTRQEVIEALKNLCAELAEKYSSFKTHA